MCELLSEKLATNKIKSLPKSLKKLKKVLDKQNRM